MVAIPATRIAAVAPTAYLVTRLSDANVPAPVIGAPEPGMMAKQTAKLKRLHDAIENGVAESLRADAERPDCGA
jgi:hypothetical protein